jgi:excisionase family DNA binding protein
MKGFVSTADTAERLGVSNTRVLQMIYEEVITGAQKFGRDWFIPETEVKRLEKTDRPAGRPRKDKKAN